MLDQLKIYHKLRESDEEKLETPGGIKLNEIENVSKFLVDKVMIKVTSDYSCVSLYIVLTLFYASDTLF